MFRILVIDYVHVLVLRLLWNPLQPERAPGPLGIVVVAEHADKLVLLLL